MDGHAGPATLLRRLAYPGRHESLKADKTTNGSSFGMCQVSHALNSSPGLDFTVYVEVLKQHQFCRIGHSDCALGLLLLQKKRIRDNFPTICLSV